MSLETEIKIYHQLSKHITAEHRYEWVVISGKNILGYFKEFEEAALNAVSEFGNKPFLIRQIDAPAPSVPHLIIDA